MDIESIIEWTFPGWAAKRTHQRTMLEHAKRAYSAAKDTTYRKRPRWQGSGDLAIDSARGTLRDWARYLDENHDLAIGIFDTLVNRIVGREIIVEPMIMTTGGKLHTRLNKQARALWKNWSKKPEVTGELSRGQMERLACRTWLRDGEVLGRHIYGRGPGIGSLDHQTRVPYSVELIECDYLPFELTSDKPLIIHGVEKDEWGRPVRYHLARNRSVGVYWQSLPIATIGDQIMTVAAADMMHVKVSKRIGQTRGVTCLHGVIDRIYDIKDYEESERIAARVAASFTAFIKKSNEFVNSGVDATSRTFEMQPGMVFDSLLPGEEIGSIGTNRPNEKLLDFRNSQLKAAAAGTGSNYSSISKNYDGTYSSQRQELVESEPHYTVMRDYFCQTFVRPIYEQFIQWAVVSGQLNIPKTGVDLETVNDLDMRGPGLPWINPKDEIVADALAVKNRLKSRHQVIRERGGDPAIVDEEIKADAIGNEVQNAAQTTTGQTPQGDTGGNEKDAGNDQQAEAA